MVIMELFVNLSLAVNIYLILYISKSLIQTLLIMGIYIVSI